MTSCSELNCLFVGVAVVGEQDIFPQLVQNEDFSHLRRQPDVVRCRPQSAKFPVQNLSLSFSRCISVTNIFS